MIKYLLAEQLIFALAQNVVLQLLKNLAKTVGLLLRITTGNATYTDLISTFWAV